MNEFLKNLRLNVSNRLSFNANEKLYVKLKKKISKKNMTFLDYVFNNLNLVSDYLNSEKSKLERKNKSIDFRFNDSIQKKFEYLNSLNISIPDFIRFLVEREEIKKIHKVQPLHFIEKMNIKFDLNTISRKNNLMNSLKEFNKNYTPNVEKYQQELYSSTKIKRLIYNLKDEFGNYKTDKNRRLEVIKEIFDLIELRKIVLKREFKEKGLKIYSDELDYIEFFDGKKMQYVKWSTQIDDLYFPFYLYPLRKELNSSKYLVKDKVNFENGEYKDSVPEFNIFCDTETEAQLYKVVSNSVLSNQVEISRDEYIKLNEENIEFCKNFRGNFHKINDELPNKLIQMTRVKVIQAVFDSPNDCEYMIWVDEKYKNDYGDNNLEYVYKQYDKEISVRAKIIYSEDITTEFFDKINAFTKRDFGKKRRLNTTIWFHNLKFDILNIKLLDMIKNNYWELKSFSHVTPSFYNFRKADKHINSKGKVCVNNILFLDSFNFFKTSLEKMGKQIGIRKEKEKVNFKLNNNLKIDKSFLEYSLMDIVILRAFLKDFFKEVKKTGKLKFGAAGTAFNSFWTHFYDDKENRIHLHKNPYLENIEKKAYFGGRTECFNRIGLWAKARALDLNSSYPSSMLQKLPIEYMYSLVKPSMSDVMSVINSDDKYCLVECIIRDNKDRVVPVFFNNRTCFPYIKYLETSVHEPELKILLEKRANIEFLKIHIYKATDNIFEKYVKYQMDKKIEGKLRLLEILSTIAKLYANAFYGKLAEMLKQTILQELTEYECKKFGIDENFVGVINDDIGDNAVFEEKGNKRYQVFGGYLISTSKLDRPAEKSSLILAGAITSYSRSALYRTCDYIGFENVCYGDTDSVYFVGNPEFNYCETLEDSKPGVINIHKNLVGKNYFWSFDYDGKYFDMLTFTNKDNIKLSWQELDEKHLLMCDTEMLQIENQVYTGFNVKTKGVSLGKALEVGDNLYYIDKWLGISEQILHYKDISTQVITPSVKWLGESRKTYSKSGVVSKAEKQIKFVKMIKELDEFGNETGRNLLNYVNNVNYTEQVLEAFTVSNEDVTEIIVKV
jgi:hypothetical protein